MNEIVYNQVQYMIHRYTVYLLVIGGDIRVGIKNMMTMLKITAVTFFIFNIAPVRLSQAQWGPDYRLTDNDSLSVTNINNAWCIANGVNNDVHVVWYDKRSGNCAIYYKRSLDRGTTWCPETAMGLHVPQYNNACIAASGRFVSIAWTRGFYEVGCICSEDCGSTWVNESYLNALDYPSVARRDSEVYVVRNNPSRSLLLFNRSTDNGASWLPENAIWNDSDIRTPSIAVSDSIVHVVWRDIQGSWATMYMRSTDSGITWSAGEVLGAGIYPSITCNDSNVHVIWDGNAGVGLLYRWSSGFGVTWSAETLLTTPLGGNFPYPSIGCSDSVVNIVWRDARDGNSEIYYKRCQIYGVGCDEEKATSYRPPMFSVAPTFLGNSIQIRCSAKITGTVRLALFNTCGSRICGKNIQCDGQVICIDNSEIAGLPKGVYFLLLGPGNNVFYIFKVVKY